MAWLDDAESLYSEITKLNSEQESRLIIKNTSEPMADVSKIKYLSIQHDYDGNPFELVSSIIAQAPLLKTVHISREISWNEICRLNLTQIEDLSFSILGDLGISSLDAPHLKKLTIFGKATLTPLELMITTVPHIDFSGMPNLEALDLRHFQLISPDDFCHLHKLKKLSITDSSLDNLAWLCDAEYSLTYLYIDGALTDCADIITQQELVTVMLHHTSIKDVSIFEKLPKLKRLDLRYGNDIDDGNLRSLPLDELQITRKDSDIASIKRSIENMLRFSVMHLISDEQQLNKIDAMTELQRRAFLHRRQLPFEEQLKQFITIAYTRNLQSFDETNHIFPLSLPREEYIAYYKILAHEYFPFL